MNSSRKINYSTRVAKNIERKMLRDMLIRLSTIFPMSEHTYVGFGSKYFTDFIMMHKFLHIENLISIEGDIGNKEKYEFNKPLNCISMEYGMSNDVLPKLNLNKNKSIVWLDYDGLLESSCLDDIAHLAGELEFGSTLFVSYNSRPPKPNELSKDYSDIDKPSERLEKYLSEKHGENYFPHDLNLQGLSRWIGYSGFLRQLVLNCINKRLEIKNRGCEVKTKVKQIINFNYQDGSEMSTVGFVFYKTEEEFRKLNSLNLDYFEFYRDGEEAYSIDVPSLTMKEIKALLEVMPSSSQADRRQLEKIIPPKEVEQFAKIYKYLPIFTDSELA